MGDPDEHVCQAAASALVTIQGDPDKALAAIKDAASKSDEPTRIVLTTGPSSVAIDAVTITAPSAARLTAGSTRLRSVTL